MAEAWRRLDRTIDKATLSRWARAAGVATLHGEKTQAATAARRIENEALREELRSSLLEKAVDLLQRMDGEHVEFKNSAKEIREVVYPIAPAGAVQNYATSVGILIDKYRLEVGEATSRSESRALTEDMDDDERQRLRDWIDSLPSAAKAPSGAEG